MIFSLYKYLTISKKMKIKESSMQKCIFIYIKTIKMVFSKLYKYN